MYMAIVFIFYISKHPSNTTLDDAALPSNSFSPETERHIMQSTQSSLSLSNKKLISCYKLFQEMLESWLTDPLLPFLSFSLSTRHFLREGKKSPPSKWHFTGGATTTTNVSGLFCL
jgi:hypothetical protein